MINNNNKNIRSSENLAKLELVARKLGELKEEVVFLGGCTTALFITDPIAPDVRPTLDVDCIIDVISLGDYYKFGERLRQHGFKESKEITCRWHFDNIILDVMPADEKILGFGNAWYEQSIKNSFLYEFSAELTIKVVSAPYFLATKLEAFKNRGNDDFFGSHDFEDIIAVIDGRPDLVIDIKQVDSSLIDYLRNNFANILSKDQFHLALPGHLNYGSLTRERAEIVLRRMEQIVGKN